MNEYLHHQTGVDVTVKDKHSPFRDRGDVCVVHIVKHPVPWLVSWADYRNSAFPVLALERSYPCCDKVLDWGSRVSLFEEQSSLTVSHQQMVTNLGGVVEGVEDVLGQPRIRPEGELSLDKRRWGAHANQGQFDPGKYVDHEYRGVFADAVLSDLESLLLEEASGEEMFEGVGLGWEWWEGMAKGTA